MSNREEFEKIERVKDILSNYNWFFDSSSNQYVLESYSGDIKCLQASNYLDGLWYMWQARVPEGYVVVPVDTLNDIHNACVVALRVDKLESYKGLAMAIIDDTEPMLEAVEQ